MKLIRNTLALFVIFVAGLTASPAEDQLPSWNDAAAKQSIIAFVGKVTKEGSPDFLPPAERIATFDNDGTLWCEQPVVELAFTKERLKELAARDPTLKEKQPFKAALDGNREYFEKAGLKAILELVIATHGNMSQAEFETEARQFFKAARHPKFGVPYAQTAFLPMVELLQYLRANGFQTKRHCFFIGRSGLSSSQVRRCSIFTVRFAPIRQSVSMRMEEGLRS